MITNSIYGQDITSDGSAAPIKKILTEQASANDEQEDGKAPAERKKDIFLKLSRLISTLMHPLIMPLYAVLLFMYGHSIMSLIPSKAKLYLLLLVIVNTFVIPALFIAVLRVTGYIKSLSLETRRDRVLPLMVTAICYVMCVFMISNFTIAILIRALFLAGTACVVFALAVTWFWKISLHMTGAGSVVGMILTINIAGLGSMFLPLIIAILLSGALASARLYLGSHTPAQVAAGFFGGLIVTSFVIL